MTVLHKNAPAEYTIDSDGDGPPTFEAIVSVFNNKDLGGDIVRPGAFRDSLDMWKSSGDPIPVYWSHRTDDPMYNIGEVVEIDELAAGDNRIPSKANAWVRENGGLHVKALIDDHGTGAQVRHLMQKRRVKQFSFSYDVLDQEQTKSGNELRRLWLHEVGPTPLGMNPLTELVTAKTQSRGPESPNCDPPPDDTAPPKRRLPSALFLRAQCDIALWHAIND